MQRDARETMQKDTTVENNNMGERTYEQSAVRIYHLSSEMSWKQM